jgi:hypothetical protein
MATKQTKTTKRELEDKVFDQASEIVLLKGRLEMLEAENKALRVGPVVESFGERFVPVALLPVQVQSVQEKLSDLFLDGFGNGVWIDGSMDLGGMYRDYVLDGSILPGYAGFVGQGFYDGITGWTLDQVWGLVQVPRPCGCCGKPTTHSYNCEVCSAE